MFANSILIFLGDRIWRGCAMRFYVRECGVKVRNVEGFETIPVLYPFI